MGNETELIKDRIDLAEVVSEYVQLKQAGRSLKGLCPFHQEKTPSFVVSPERNSWYCFGCFPPGQKIKTPFGYHDIESLDSSHYVVSGTGEIRKIIRPLERNYRGDLVTVALHRLGYPVKVTADHNILALRGTSDTNQYKNFSRTYKKYLVYLNEDNEEKYFKKTRQYFPIRKIPAGKLRKGDLLLYPIDDIVEDRKTIDLEQYLKKTLRKGSDVFKLRRLQPVSPDLLKLAGYYISKGSTQGEYVIFTLKSHEEDLAQDIVRLVKKIFGLKAVIRQRKTKADLKIIVRQAHLAEIFQNLLGKGAENKHIPFEWQRLPAKKQRILGEAIFRGSGTPFIGDNSITTPSQVLTEQLTDIFLRLNIFPSVSINKAQIDKKGINDSESFTLKWSGEADDSYNLVYYDQGKRYWILPISSLTRESYEGPVYNLTVDKDHSYIATSFAVANCSEGGDIFSFIQKVEGLDFVGSLKMMAERAGVELKSRGSGEVSGDRRQRLFDLLALTARFYYQILRRHKAGSKSIRYLKERGVTEDTIDAFGLGYSPDSWDTLQKFLRQKGYREDEMVEAGVVGRSQRGKLYDRFRGRIMFPIADTQGRIVAFGGRIVPWMERGDEGKYINSPETSLYEKRRVVYNLNKAKQHLRNNPCIVVEGYMDVIMLVQHGIQNVVASSGTAFTQDQIKQIGRFTDRLHFAFDADGAGFKATLSATETALLAGMRVATITIASGKDPADLALSDPDNLAEHFKNSRSLVAVMLEQLKSTVEADSRQEQLKALLPLVARVHNPVQQGEMIQEIANILHIPESRVLSLLRQYGNESSFNFISEQDKQEDRRSVNPEYHLLGIVLCSPAARREVFPQLNESFFLDPSSLKMYKILVGLSERESGFLDIPSDNLFSIMPAEDIPFAEGVYALSEDFLSTSKATPVEEGKALLYMVKERSLKSRLNAMQEKLASIGSDKDRADALREFQILAEELSQINRQL